MNYLGIDYHKKYSHAVIVNERGEILKSDRIENTPEVLRLFLEDIDGPCEAVLEASRTWGVMFDILEGEENVNRVTLAHPLKVRAIAEAKIKTDKIDAEMLAQLLRVDLIPSAHIPGKQTRSIKEMLRQRVFLVRLRTRIKNRIHVLLDRLHIPLPKVTDMFGKRGTQYLKGIKLEGVDQELMEEDLHLLEVLNDLIKRAEKEIAQQTQTDERVKLLQTIPGIGVTMAAIIAMEIDEVSRFREAKKLCSYAGLVPTTYSSGGKTYHGRLMPWCNKWLRWCLVEAAWIAVRNSAYFKQHYETRKYRKGVNAAVISTARRLCEVVWHVLSEKREYEDRPIRSRSIHQTKVSSAALTGN